VAGGRSAGSAGGGQGLGSEGGVQEMSWVRQQQEDCLLCLDPLRQSELKQALVDGGGGVVQKWAVAPC
jgi:hypothetical protein